MENHTIKRQAIKAIEEEIKKELKSDTLVPDDHLIEKGLSSIMIMRLSNKLRSLGIRVSFIKLMENPTLKEWEHLIEHAKVKEKKQAVLADKKNQGQAFALTDVQYAYWVGRGDDQPLGGVGCHAYLEIDGIGVDPKKLNAAWHALQMHHAMLRASFTLDGRQIIKDKPYATQIGVYDLKNQSDLEVEISLKELRDKLSHRRLKIEEGEVAGVNIALLPCDKTRIFLDVDLLISDVLSLSILIEDLAIVYSGGHLETSSAYTFKTYIENQTIDQALLMNDKAYWENKIKTLPKESPHLPLKTKPELVMNTVFNRRREVIDKSSWENLKSTAAKYKTTPSMVLLTCYALIIERWCNQDAFLINMPLFNRDTENIHLKRMVADFTNLLLIDYKRKPNETFLDTLQRIRATFLENVSHSAYSGVQVQRDIYKEVGDNNFVAPIVFACNLDYGLETELSQRVFGKMSYMVSQTPQVWLDFQTYVIDEALVLCWDAVEELYPEQLLDDMFGALVNMIKALSKSDDWHFIYDVLPENQKRQRMNELNEILPLQYPNQTLYDHFIHRVKQAPNAVALIDGTSGITITYQALYDKALDLATFLKDQGICKGDYIGITLPRGYRQIYAILGILFAGGVYVPIGINQPKDRRAKIYQQIGVCHVISDLKTIQDYALNEAGISVLDIDHIPYTKNTLTSPVVIKPQDSAYVIMTSGSTGMPKGVELCHENALNTIIDINNKYNINSTDTVLMVSAIDFDLSVYDIFGLLGAGGKIVVLSESNYKDPDLWIRLINQYEITIWNSVPILFDMLVTMAEGKSVTLPLNIVMLSGDWIGIDLPARFYKRSNQATVVAMGGATEAAIWSNYLNVPKEIPKEWVSIPYGKALNNQIYRVVDDFGRLCPNDVKGELWIGGVGLAKCYRGDTHLTNKKFVVSDTRWYRTGDNGRIWQDGTIEFLGRQDGQVKIRGHRIELGEIKAALNALDAVADAVVDIYTDHSGDRHIVAYLEVDHKHNVQNNHDFVEREWQTYSLWQNQAIDEGDFKETLNRANIMSCKVMLDTLQKMQILQEGQTYTFDDIIQHGNIANSQVSTIQTWLDDLMHYQFIKREAQTYTLNSDSVLNMHTTDGIGIEKISQYINTLSPHLPDLLQGTVNPIEIYYAQNQGLTPNDLAKSLPGLDSLVDMLIMQIEKIFITTSKKISILEYGTRDFETTMRMIEAIKDKDIEYIYADPSLMYINQAKTLLSHYDFVTFKLMDIDDTPDTFSDKVTYDCIIMVNALHRSKHLKQTFKHIKSSLAFKGMLLILELTLQTCLQSISAQILSAHDSKSGNTSIYNATKWKNTIIENGFDKVDVYPAEASIYGRTIITVMNTQREQKCDVEQLKLQLEGKIPSYMIPQKYHIVDQFPINKNGKLDIKALAQLNITDFKERVYVETCTTKTQEKLKKVWQDVFQIKEVNTGDNYYALGGDSLIATRMVSKIRDTFNVDFSITDVMALKTIRAQASKIETLSIQKNKTKFFEQPAIIPDNMHQNDAFILTDIQQAYFIGRSGTHHLGGVSTHCYFELDSVNLDIKRVQESWNNMIAYHGMMRSVILNDGTQRILKKVPEYQIETFDFSRLSYEEEEQALLKVRLNMSHQVIDLDRWPLFDVKISMMHNDRMRIHISFDNIIFDGWSMFYLLNEWKERYDNKELIYPELALTFRDYVLGLERIKNTALYEKDKQYWTDRLDSFLSAPQLPLVKDESEIKVPTFNRRTGFIDKHAWESLKNIAKRHDITATSLLITLYAETLRHWSINKAFALNITQFNRMPLHPQVNQLVGDFTTLTLLEVNNAHVHTFAKRAKVLQGQMTKDLDHKMYSAVALQRALRRKNGNIKGSMMPIVFTSGLGVDAWGQDKWLGELVYNISQTPQVWLDHQVVENNGGLSLFWDSVDELFVPDVLDRMFESYVKLLNTLANHPALFNEKITFFNDIDVSMYQKDKDGKQSTILKPQSIEHEENVTLNKTLTEVCTTLSEAERYEILMLLSDILGSDIQTTHQTFFQLGGDSLKAIKLVNTINEKINVEIDLNMLFDNPTIEALLIEIGRLKEALDIGCEGVL